MGANVTAGIRRAAGRTTPEKLLDVAEGLFARYGYDGVGLRAIAETAGVNLNAINYHFESKEKLYVETFLRRFRPANVERLRLLQSAERQAEGSPLPVERVVECMVRPPLLVVLQYPDFAALLARNLFLPPPFLGLVMRREAEPTNQIFLAALARALPRYPPSIVRLREMFLLGAVLVFAARRSALGDQAAASKANFELILEDLVRFVSAGLRAPPGRRPRRLPPPGLA